MKVLFLPAYFEPELAASGYLSTNRNEAFAAAGFDMLVYTPVPTRGVSEEVRKIYEKRKEEHLYDGRMKVLRFPLIRERKNPLQRALRYIMAAFKQYWWATHSQEAKQCDVMLVASTPPIQGAMAALVKKRTHIPFVYNLQDIFPDSLVGTGLAKKGGLLWRIGRMIENFTYRNADKIIVISEDFKRNIMAKGVPEEKIEIIYNWVDEQTVVPIPSEDNPLFEELGLERGLFYVVYAGNLGHAQNVNVLLEAAEILHGEKDLRFLVFGSGGLKTEYENYVSSHGLDNVCIFPLQPAERVSYVYSLADTSLVSCKKGFGGSAMPSKTWSIMSTGTAVLCSFDCGGDLQHIVEDNHIGLFSEAGDAQALSSNIMTLYRDRELCKEYGTRGRKWILQNLTKDVGTTHYVSLLKHFTFCN